MVRRIYYDIEVLCRHCDEVHPRDKVKVIPNWGWQCPDCGRKCRTKVSYNRERWLEKKQREKVKFRCVTIKTDIRNAQRERMEQKCTY